MLARWSTFSIANHATTAQIAYEPLHDKSNRMTFAPSEVSDQPLSSLIRGFAVRLKDVWVLNYP